MKCPCCSGKTFNECCKPYLDGKTFALTPEALMRSRYSAYSMANIAYIHKTMRGRPALNFDGHNAERWAKRVIWIKLEVLHAECPCATGENIGKELCSSISSSALRAPSPHVWGEGNKEEFLWEDESPNKGYVEFIATMVDGNQLSILHEKSEFIQEDGQWYYVDGLTFPQKTKQLISRNTACPCGSQSKFKNCHGKR